MTTRMNIAVIGTGRMGSVHVRNLVRKIPEANLVAICDIRLEVAQALADEMGIPRVVADYHELLADPSIPAVLIATSTDTHWFIARDAALAGKHIFCEKPSCSICRALTSRWPRWNRQGSSSRSASTGGSISAFRRVHDLVTSGASAGPASCTSPAETPSRPRSNTLRLPAACIST